MGIPYTFKMEISCMFRIGIDVGSTTMKLVVLDDEGKLVYSDYQRHYSDVIERGKLMLSELMEKLGDLECETAISGSAGMGLSVTSDIPFVQEVYATRKAAGKYLPDTDTIIELGGEDAKILFLTGGLEVRMNGTCAGGTGAFIDQMATLLGIERDDLGRIAEDATEIYTIASRCGVFAKSDVQPLINQGARTADIAASILVAVVNQTIGGLAQGRKIKGNVVYLGGPLTFIPALRRYFDEALHTKGTCPENSLYFVALGAALSKGKVMKVGDIIGKLSEYKGMTSFTKLPPLFETYDDYEEFKYRHSLAQVGKEDISSYRGNAYLGIDAGSTTIKSALIAEDGKLLLSQYQGNNGDPMTCIREFLLELYRKYPDVHIVSAASTGYGEELLKNALDLDYSLVETMAHFRGARHFQKDVDFIIDIGGQDMKCFRIRDGVVDDIFLNEACSSGCGSFLETFAKALGKTAQEFAELAVNAKSPVDLGSRCTVFMNSSVKQAQKDGASVSDISAGLAISVVKNALYKVIRTANASELGENIIVQGGTFLNDAVLRAFELELGHNVVRPDIAGLMGAFGAALYAREKAQKDGKSHSTILNLTELEEMKHEVRSVRCNGCGNHCLLTINNFGGGRRLISGNRCEKPVTGRKSGNTEDYDIYEYKRKLLSGYMEERNPKAKRGTIGLPMALGMYELLPFYHKVFTELGYDVVVSPFSNRELYVSGQGSIPSDTICFPAKLVHGHIEYLKSQKVDRIFIPASTYNVDEKKGTNHFNCPVVAYYGEVIRNNQDMEGTDLVVGFLSLEHPHHTARRISELFSLPLSDCRKAVKKGFEELGKYHDLVSEKGREIMRRSRVDGRRIIVLAGRPYHTDPEVNHEIDKLIVGLGASVISEDSVASLVERKDVGVLNQWTYHARIYDAARYVTEHDDMSLVQLVSFGCGLDAVTTDETREILKEKGKIYTQLKIDEITNMGAVKIRLRSLFAALEDRA